MKWTTEELKRVAHSLGTNETEDGMKSHPLLDCIEIERFMFPALHVTLGCANRLLKDAVEHADIVVERTPEVAKAAQETQVEAQLEIDLTKKETVTPANMHALQGHSDEQIQVEGAPSDKEREEAMSMQLPKTRRK
jgi:hypothetical protein